MLARGDEIRAVARTLNLDQTFGAAADGADVFAERRTRPTSTPQAAEGTNHRSIIV